VRAKDTVICEFEWKRMKAEVNYVLRNSPDIYTEETGKPITSVSKGVRILITGLCIQLSVYQLNIGTPPYATNFFGTRFIVHFTLHVLASIGGHLQVVYKHIKIYSR
jgi:hypothetical protein